MLKKTVAVNSLPTELLNGEIVHSSHTSLLKETELRLQARKVHIFSGLKNKALLSIGTFCDNGYIAVFDNKAVNIINKTTSKVIMHGGRDKIIGLYMIELEANTQMMTEYNLPDILYANNI